ncbi:MAG: hypothetical protein ABI906_05765 [Pseudomonadota bacterium]
MADALQFGESELQFDPSVVKEAVELCARSDNAVEAAPFRALNLALIRGYVIALGEYDLGHRLKTYLIEAADWPNLTICADEGGVTYVRDSRYSLTHRLGTIENLRFDRSSVVGAFPEISQPSPAPGALKIEESPNADGEGRLREALRAEMDRAGFLIQKRGEEIAHEGNYGVGRTLVRLMVKELTGNDRRGPIKGVAELRQQLRHNKITPG